MSDWSDWSDWLALVILAAVQGVTEFLPVSSSAHLALTHALGINVEHSSDVEIDIALHVGTWFALCWYCRQHIVQMIHACIKLQYNSAGAFMIVFLIISTIPVVLSGLLFSDVAHGIARSLSSIAWVNLIAATALIAGFYVSKLKTPDTGTDTDAGLDVSQWFIRLPKQRLVLFAIICGCAQALAIFPGASRSGVCMTAGLLLLLPPRIAVKLSLLMAIPVIPAAAVYQIWQLYTEAEVSAEVVIPWIDLMIAASIAAVFAFAAINLVMRFANAVGLVWMSGYRLILSALLFSVTI